MTLQIGQPQTRRWTREEYYRLADEGWFDGQHVQLIEGDIIQMPPQKHAHAKAVSVAARFLRSAFGDGYWIREEKPLNLGDSSDPEPDVAVVEGDLAQFEDHPTSAVLLVEVSDRSLDLDRGRKLRLYARAGVPEYWIVDLRNRSVIVHRRPNNVSSGYDEVTIFTPGQSASPQLRSEARLDIGTLF